VNNLDFSEPKPFADIYDEEWRRISRSMCLSAFDSLAITSHKMLARD